MLQKKKQNKQERAPFIAEAHPSFQKESTEISPLLRREDFPVDR